MCICNSSLNVNLIFGGVLNRLCENGFRLLDGHSGLIVDCRLQTDAFSGDVASFVKAHSAVDDARWEAALSNLFLHLTIERLLQPIDWAIC